MTPEERADGSTSNAAGWWIAIGALVVVALGLWLWKGVAVDRAEERHATEREAWREETRQALAQRTEALLALSAEPLGLAVRDAAMAENWGTVGTYLDRVAGVEGVQRVVFAARDTVRVATDSSLEGRPSAGIVPGAIVEADGAGVVEADGAWHVAVPITGLNERIGVLVLTYAPPPGPYDEPAGEEPPADE